MLLGAVALGFPGRTSADTLQLLWDRSIDSNVEGYVVYVGVQPGVYMQTFDVGNADSFRMASIVPGQQYCFAVTAYVGNAASRFSNEACGYSNMYPTLAALPTQNASLGIAASLQLVGNDPLGDLLTYSAAGLPAGLTVRADSGLISGTPTASGTYIVTATVSDGVLSASRTFTWIIAALKGAPASSTTTSSASNSTPIAHRPTASATYVGTVARRRNASPAASSTTGTPASSGTARSVAREAAASHVDSTTVTVKSAVTTASADTACGPGDSCVSPAAAITPTPDAATTPPTADVRVEILTPVHQAMLSTSVMLIGHIEGIDAAATRATIVWTSDRDGRLGTGERVVTVLRRGTHVITASIVAAPGHMVSTSVTVEIAK